MQIRAVRFDVGKPASESLTAFLGAVSGRRPLILAHLLRAHSRPRTPQHHHVISITEKTSDCLLLMRQKLKDAVAETEYMMK